jgi:alpha-glucosidase
MTGTSKKLFYLIILLQFSIGLFAEEYTLLSPDNQLKIDLQIDKKISFKAFYQNDLLFGINDISLHLKNDEILGRNPLVNSSTNTEINELINPVIKEKESEIKNHCNELTLWLEGELLVKIWNYKALKMIPYGFRVQEPLIHLMKHLTKKKE